MSSLCPRIATLGSIRQPKPSSTSSVGGHREGKRLGARTFPGGAPETHARRFPISLGLVFRHDAAVPGDVGPTGAAVPWSERARGGHLASAAPRYTCEGRRQRTFRYVRGIAASDDGTPNGQSSVVVEVFEGEPCLPCLPKEPTEFGDGNEPHGASAPWIRHDA